MPGVLAAALAVCAGCLQLETRIALQPDGSAIVTERLQFSRALLDLSSAQPDLNVAPLLERERVLERMALMGKGMTLVSHEVRAAAAGARESLAVFNIPDIREFQYVSPYLAYADYASNNVIKCQLFPVYESTWYGRPAGHMAVNFTLLRAGQRPPQPREGEPRPPEPTPDALQPFRDLQPIARDMLSGFAVKVTFESFAPLGMRMYYRYRNQQAATREFDLIDWSDRNLDPSGSSVLENEEVMLETVRGRFDLPNVLAATGEAGSNATLPLYHAQGIPEIYFKPSAQMFKAYFEGKTLKAEKRGEWPARAEELVFRPPETARTAPTGT